MPCPNAIVACSIGRQLFAGRSRPETSPGKPVFGGVPKPAPDLLSAQAQEVRYVELHCKTNFSFLEGASHPDELVKEAAILGYAGMAVTDRNSLSGVVRAHLAASKLGFKLLIGAEGTLGVVTAAALKLFPQLVSRAVAIAGVATPADAVALLGAAQETSGGAVRAGGPDLRLPVRLRRQRQRAVRRPGRRGDRFLRQRLRRRQRQRPGRGVQQHRHVYPGVRHLRHRQR